MEIPFKNIFKGHRGEEKPEYTGETKFTTDATGNVTSEEMAAADKKFEEGED